MHPAAVVIGDDDRAIGYGEREVSIDRLNNGCTASGYLVTNTRAV